jgi:hypothetical protein
MIIWYIHALPRGTHERNLYLHKEIAKSWREDGHKVAVLDLSGPMHGRAVKAKNAKCDVAFIANFKTVDALEREGLDIIKRTRFRVLITGGGWRRPDWIRRSLKAVDKVKANLVCLTHMSHYGKFKKVHRKVFHVGLGFDPTIFYPDWKRERRGIVFCGDLGMGRKRRLKLLAKKFPKQVDWVSLLTHSQMAEYHRNGAIGWNQIGRGPEDGVSCNLRVWETIGSGLFLLCSRSKHVPLKDGIHYMAWDSDEDMLDKAKYYLDHPDEREAIARQGWEESANHTWRHRALEYKELVEKYL